MKKNILNKGFLAKLANVKLPIFYYCNEQDDKKGRIIFKCCAGCRHNPLVEQLEKLDKKAIRTELKKNNKDL